MASVSSWGYSAGYSIPSKRRQSRLLAISVTRFLNYNVLFLHGACAACTRGQPRAQHPTQNPQSSVMASRPLPKRLLPVPITRRSVSSTSTAKPPWHREPIFVTENFHLTELESKIFDHLKAFLVYYNLKTQLRVAGGWVRDKLLQKKCGDIDIALDNMFGKAFCKMLLNYFRRTGIETNGFGVIRSNPLQAKHLEVARMEIFGVMIDFVNLRSHDYSENNSMSVIMDFGTAIEDAFRRDLTINSLFYNINTGMVEDLTGRGLADLKAGIVATPLPAKDTFTDDPLRALRALRFVATLGYELHHEAKDAIDSDIRLDLSTKISRERIGGEMDRIFRSNKPLRAIELLIETELFPVVFKMPSEAEMALPEGIERSCLHALEAVTIVLGHFGISKLPVDHRKSLYLAAFLSPLRNYEYEQKDKMVTVPTGIIKNALKLRSVDAAMVATLHRTADSFSFIRKLLLKMESIDQGNSESPVDGHDAQSSQPFMKHQIETLLSEMRGLWRSALLLGTVLEDESILSCSYEKRNSELIRRSNLCIYVEEAIMRLGLDKARGPSPFIYRTGSIDDNG